MANKNRNKGNYHEIKVIEWLEEIGFEAEKQPLSGQLGGKYRGDITIEINGRRLVVEVKYRDGGSFPSAFTVMEERDMAIYKRKVGKPKQVVIIDADIFASTIAPLLITGKPVQKRKRSLPEDWQPSASLQASIDSKLQENIDHEFEANQFCDYHISKGSTFADFDRAYRNWCRNTVKFRQEKQSSKQTARSKQSRSGGQESNFFAGIVDGLSSD